MGFFKPSAAGTSNKSVARLQALIWILIYAGLLTLVLGLSAARIDAAVGWPLVLAGGVVAATGFFLIWVRSRMDVKK
jgi:membrane-associated phospholipid phosphatase